MPIPLIEGEPRVALQQREIRWPSPQIELSSLEIQAMLGFGGFCLSCMI